MTTVVAGILMLGFLVFIHELGHFVVAKMCGVKVLKFSLGFGPRLGSMKRGETEYQICLIPLGGYVQMLGEGYRHEDDEDDLTEEEKERSFALKPLYQRLAIVCAGPAMNLILPFLILPLSFMIGAELPSYLEQQAVIGYVAPESAASETGFVAGDKVLSINSENIASWNDANKAFVSDAGEALVFEVERNGKPVQLVMSADNNSLEGMQALGLLPQQRALIGGLAEGMPAAQAGLQAGDLILSIGDQKIASWYDLKTVIQAVGAHSVPVVAERSGKEITVELTPQQQDDNGIFLIGIAPMTETTISRFGVTESLRAGAQRSWELIDLTVVFIHKLITGNVSSKTIGGPITVVQVAGQAAQTDLAAVLSVLAFISIQLGILNLLPIPILDGGHILFYTIELIFRRPLSFRVREMAQQLGMALLLTLMAFAFYNDILRLWD
ncbi:MAG: RIP metalloprotease RseP [Desulfuromonas sp.]|nr:MAG: RIP metalloprotease RseP [Desulfuromonas sp.]